MRLLAAAAVLTFAAGLAAARAPHDLAPVDAAMQAIVVAHGLDGASLRLSRDGQVVYRRAFGGYGGGEQLAIASASKWLSALVLARLVEQGTLAWDDTVGDYLPEAPPATHAITLAQLFSHTSGIDIADAPCVSQRNTTLDACARQILAMPLAWAPGTTFAYGGNSMQVAGRLAELASGRSWDALFLAEVVRPLGLVATDWSAGWPIPGYVPQPNPRIAGGARSSLDDYGRVVDMVLAGGTVDGQPYLSPATLATMAVDRSQGLAIASTPGEPGWGYGIGQWIEARDVDGSAIRVSSPGAFGFTPWVDWRNGSSGVFVVRDSRPRLNDDLLALQALCLAQLDFVRHTQSAPQPPRAPARAAGPRPATRLDATRRAD